MERGLGTGPVRSETETGLFEGIGPKPKLPETLSVRFPRREARGPS